MRIRFDISIVMGLLLLAPVSVLAQQPSAECTDSITALDLELGQGVPLPRRYSNPTGQAVTFIVTMRANPLFGPQREVMRTRLEPRTGMIMSESPVHLTELHTPVGSAHVVFDVTTDRTGNEVVGRCDYQLKMKPPPLPASTFTLGLAAIQRSGLYQVPVRLCVLAGSNLAEGKQPGELIGGNGVFDRLKGVNDDIWFPQAKIAFSSRIDHGVPVIEDPTPPATSCGVRGDLNSAGFAAGDGPFAEAACAQAWETHYPGRVGLAVVIARSFCASGPALGAAPGPDLKLFVASHKAFSGQRGDDLCGSPRRLTTADIVNDRRRPFVIIVEPARNSNFTKALAHELGHNLHLGHGNGLDDDKDGRAAGFPGPKRYDEYCDPRWLIPPDNEILAEDSSTVFVDCETNGSLMQGAAGCSTLQPLQIETARGVAPVMPGFVDATPVPVVTPH